MQHLNKNNQTKIIQVNEVLESVVFTLNDAFYFYFVPQCKKYEPLNDHWIRIEVLNRDWN